jgi:hypothetical protein
MTTLADGIQALINVRNKIDRLERELEEAKAERERLELLELPPIFLAARAVSHELDNGAKATKSLHAYARLAKGGPKRLACLDWLSEIGEQDAIKATLTGQWGRGEIEIAKAAYDQLRRDNSARVTFDEKVDWQTLQAIVLREVKSGKIVPLDEIGATIGDRVTITRNPTIEGNNG